MNPILYVETNLLIGAARGQTMDDLLDALSAPIRVIMPSICAMEAMSVIESETKSRDDFERVIRDRYLRQLARDKMPSKTASNLVTSLEDVIINSEKYLNSVKFRLNVALDQTTQRAEWITCDGGVIAKDLKRKLSLSPTDKFILSMILQDAAKHPGIRKAFLSGDAHFAADEIQNELNQSSIRHFKNMSSALGWLTHPPSA